MNEMFLASKLIWPVIAPHNWLLIGLLVTLLALFQGHHGVAKKAAAFTFAFALLVTIFPFGEIFLAHQESAFPPNPPLEQVDGIIVLGGGEDAYHTQQHVQTHLNEAAERFTEALLLAKRFPSAKLLFTGGSSALTGARLPGSIVADRFFREHGVNGDRLLIESDSRDTSENARFSYKLAHPAQGERWVLITSAFHMRRAISSFNAAGWRNVVPYPVDYRAEDFWDGVRWDLPGHLSNLSYAVKEIIGSLIYQGR
jgi:uncharacterized SAM-binding protein YcdF (DUF218 family)